MNMFVLAVWADCPIDWFEKDMLERAGVEVMLCRLDSRRFVGGMPALDEYAAIYRSEGENSSE